MRRCWLRQFSDRPCEGPACHKAHLLKQQTIRRAFPRGVKVPAKVLWDPRVWRRACRRHHHDFDNGRLVVPRESVPEDTERFAAEHRLSWYLDKRYARKVAA